MKFKIKAVVAALAMVAAGGANAAINPGQSGQGAGELFLSVYDSVAAESYTRDLGITVDDFITSLGSSSSSSWNSSFTAKLATDSVYTNLFGNNNSANMVWNLVGVRTDKPGADVAKYGLYATSNDASSAVSSMSYTNLKSSMLQANSYIAGANSDANVQFGDALNAYAQNRSTTNTSSTDDGYYGNAITWSSDIGRSLTFNDEAAVGTSLAFYHIGAKYDPATNKLTSPAGTYTDLFAGTWALTANGALSYDVASAPPVPLPPAVLLLGSALAGLVGVARRRQQDEVLSV